MRVSRTTVSACILRIGRFAGKSGEMAKPGVVVRAEGIAAVRCEQLLRMRGCRLPSMVAVSESGRLCRRFWSVRVLRSCRRTASISYARRSTTTGHRGTDGFRSVEGDDTLKDASIRSEKARFSRERQAQPQTTSQPASVLNLSDISHGA
jgi:hypothetical protein